MFTAWMIVSGIIGIPLGIYVFIKVMRRLERAQEMERAARVAAQMRRERKQRGMLY